MLKSERIKKWAGIIIVLSIFTIIVISYFSELSLVDLFGVTLIVLGFESVAFLVIFGIARLTEKLSHQTPVQKPTSKNKKNQRTGDVLINNQVSLKCSKCGNEIENGMIFCDKCGSRIK